MEDYKEPLNLNEKYSFDVLVKDNDTNFAGRLVLSPEGCTLSVMGERSFSPDFFSSQLIECFTLREYFLLSEVSSKSWRSTSLRLNNPQNRGGFYEIEFTVGFVIKSSSQIRKHTIFKGFSIETEMLRKWTGITNKQNELLHHYGNRTLDFNSINLNLFQVLTENHKNIFLSYNVNAHTSLENISSGVKITPYFGIVFQNPKEMHEIYKEIGRTYALLAYFWGMDFPVNYIKLFLPDASHTYISAYSLAKKKVNLTEYALIPLGYDTRDNYNDYRGLPLEIFNTYNELSDSRIDFFIKYIRYSRLNSDEEKFLGYFRILEKIVHEVGSYVDSDLLETLLNRSEDYLTVKLDCKKRDIKSLRRRVIQANNGKYNTATCITRFYETIPDELKSIMKYEKKDIEKICGLRNNITHANEYYVTDADLYSYTKFIQQLLSFALFNKVLEAPLDLLIPLTTRFERI